MGFMYKTWTELLYCTKFINEQMGNCHPVLTYKYI